MFVTTDLFGSNLSVHGKTGLDSWFPLESWVAKFESPTDVISSVAVANFFERSSKATPDAGPMWLLKS